MNVLGTLPVGDLLRKTGPPGWISASFVSSSTVCRVGAKVDRNGLAEGCEHSMVSMPEATGASQMVQRTQQVAVVRSVQLDAARPA